jgi:hypothetical protein
VGARTRAALPAAALLVAAGAALAWAWRAEREDRREAAAKARDERVFAFDAKDVAEVVVHARGDATRLVRDGDGWRLAAPVEAPADAFAAGALVDRLAGLRRTREVAPPPGGDLAAYGLASPRARLEIRLADGRRETLAVGAQSAFDGSVFVRPTSGAVLVAPPDTGWALERGSADLRAKPPPPADAPAGKAAADAPAEKRVDPEKKSP